MEGATRRLGTQPPLSADAFSSLSSRDVAVSTPRQASSADFNTLERLDDNVSDIGDISNLQTLNGTPTSSSQAHDQARPSSVDAVELAARHHIVEAETGLVFIVSPVQRRPTDAMDNRSFFRSPYASPSTMATSSLPSPPLLMNVTSELVLGWTQGSPRSSWRYR